jgi:deoxyribodipyrimidine photo-lyase
VPELAGLPGPWIFKHWEAPADVAQSAGVRLGRTYPRPMVDHSEVRGRALAAYSQIRVE